MGVLGGGIKFRNPLSPNTTNARPIRIRAMVGRWRANVFGSRPIASSALSFVSGVILFQFLSITNEGRRSGQNQVPFHGVIVAGPVSFSPVINFPAEFPA